MKLYYSAGACSLTPHIVLEELGVSYQAISAPTKTHKLPDGSDYYLVNPLGYVPLLVLEDGRQLREGPAITQYLADLAPEKNLAPANGSFERYQLQESLNFIATELHKNFSPCSILPRQLTTSRVSLQNWVNAWRLSMVNWRVRLI